MSDPRELIGLLAAGCPDLESAGATSVRGDARQMLAGAMAAIRPAWAADLLLARYADDMGARNRAVHGAMVEAAHWYRSKRGRPSHALPALIRVALDEHISPPACEVCAGTGRAWALDGGALRQTDCRSCRNGRVPYDATAREERMQLCRASWYRVDAPMPWSVYGADYLRVLSLLRSVERGAVDTLREQLVALAA